MNKKPVPIRMSDKLKKETQECAEIEEENISEYVRKAIETRNTIVRKENKNVK